MDRFIRSRLPVLCAGAIAGILAAASPRVLGAQRWQPHLGIHGGTPQRASVALGVLRVVRQASDGNSQSGPRLVVEPGLRAGKLRFGYAVTGPFAIGYSLEGAVLREWGRNGKPEFPRTLYGFELHGSMFFDLGLGFYAGGAGGATRLALSAGLVL
jgi:hypothetical protein